MCAPPPPPHRSISSSTTTQLAQATARARQTGMEKSHYASRVPVAVRGAHVVMGALQISVGMLVFITNIVSLTYSFKGDKLSWPATGGIWSSPFFIVAGICGIVAGKSVRSCTLCCVVSSLIFCILAAIISFAAFVEHSIMTKLNSRNRETYQEEVVYTANIVGCVLLATEVLLAFIHMIFACRASCCCVPNETGQVVRLKQETLTNFNETNQQPASNPVAR